ncbi:hypothetical protein ACA910_005428 [Epithemia clementina (nom. ined.)]
MGPKPVKFEYLDLGHLGGRGGVLRFFLLTHGIPYEETLFKYTPEIWGVEKKRLIESGENPCGTVPVVFLDNNVQLCQHMTICRYMARAHKLDSGDALKDCIQDIIADEYQGFRDLWVEKSFFSTEELKTEYRTKTVPENLTKFEALHKKYKMADPYLSTTPGGKPLWGDCALFSLLYDHIETGYFTEDDLQAYPSLAAMYKAHVAIPAVAGWIKEKKPKK